MTISMSRPLLAAALGGLIAAGPAFAQTAKENYSYTAPSGMFSEGTTKWQMYRFMAEDHERTHGTGAGATTGSIGRAPAAQQAPSTVQGSAIDEETYGQPGRRTTRRTN